MMTKQQHIDYWKFPQYKDAYSDKTGAIYLPTKQDNQLRLFLEEQAKYGTATK
ncbi:MAG: hypothetical protein LBU90_08335 [Bacteroidales bacterium]|jgi:hypothetical protein|nr:hypothetical protein [Bacteroidales bacterium]